MTRKRFIKLLMAYRIPRDEAVRAAKAARRYRLPYHAAHELALVVMFKQLLQSGSVEVVDG